MGQVLRELKVHNVCFQDWVIFRYLHSSFRISNSLWEIGSTFQIATFSSRFEMASGNSDEGERMNSADESAHNEQGGNSQQSGTPDEERASDWEDEVGGKQEHHLRLKS